MVVNTKWKQRNKEERSLVFKYLLYKTHEVKIKSVCTAIILVLLYSCSYQPKDSENEYTFFAAPLTYPLNTKEGYKINPVSGDSIKPIINSLGDTVETGIPIPAVGKVIDPNSVQKAKVVRAGKPRVTLINSNVHVIPKMLNVIPVDVSKLKKIKLGEGDSTFVLVNRVGDTIPTGVPIPAIGKKVPCIQPQSVTALPLRMKETATCNIQYLDVDQGMIDSEIHCLLEDKNGNLWFGTVGSGVSRYDGKSFFNYTEREGLINKFVMSSLEDKTGNLWFGTVRGVTCYNGTGFTDYSDKGGLPNNDISSILQDKSGNIWFGTWGGGVSRFDGISFTNYTEKEGLPNHHVSSIVEDKSGNLWFGTWGGGASCFDGTSFTHYTEKEGLSRNLVYSILEDRLGNLWFGFGEAGGGVSRFDGSSFTNYTEKDGLSSNEVSGFYEDKRGNIWFETVRGGVSRFDGTSFTHFTQKEGIHGIEVESILEDKTGIFWFGTGKNGVSRYDETTFLRYYEQVGLSNNEVLCLLEDKSGNLWFGTENDGVFRYDGSSFTQYTEKEGLCKNAICSILEDEIGNLWFGTWGGGVSRFDGTSFTNYTEKEGLSNNYVSSILEDKGGNLWFGTLAGGVSRFNGTNFTHYTEKEGLIYNTIQSILEDKRGNLWFGTFSGVSRFDGTSFTNYTEKEGLSNNDVLSILEDKNGNLWVSTDQGINYFVMEGTKAQQLHNINQNKKEAEYPKIYVLGKQEGFKDMDFDNRGALIDSKNQAWWGTTSGLVMLDLSKFTVPVEPPLIYLRQVDINEQLIDYHQVQDSSAIGFAFSAVSPFENYPLNLRLPHDKNHLTFHYYGIDWAAPHKIKYTYKLEGNKSGWSSPTEDIKVDYRNLTSGTYTFKVKAIGMAQAWSKPFEYTFTIFPPWWLSKYAYGFYLFSFIGGIFGTDRFLRRRLLQNERERNRVQALKQKASELEMQAMRAQMNPHFIFNSLNSINNFILKNDKLQASEYLIKFSKLIRLILENSTLTLISLGQELEALKLYIELEALRFQHRFDYQIIFSKDLDITSIKVPPLLLQPFVENAIHHGLMPKEGPGHLKITITEIENKLFLKIVDDGIGRHQSALNNANASHKHKSLGLQVTAERIGFLNKEHSENSKIEINDLTDEEGKALGTEISILIPVII